MLHDVTDDVKKHYYDSKLHGVDWDAKVREAKEKIDKAESLNRALTAVAVVLDSLNDSHTVLVPPGRPYVHDYGFQMQMIGDRCYVARVRPGSDAETKGIKAGDEIVTLNGYTPTRADFSEMAYLFWVLRPQPGLRLNLRSPEGGERQIDVIAKFRERQRVRDISGSGIFDLIREMEDEEYLVRARYAERGDDLLIVKFPVFLPSFGEVESIVSKMHHYKSVVLDLRADPGGSEDALISLLGGVFKNKVKVGDRVRRNATHPIETEPFRTGFDGKLVVLIDGRSASAAELFARVIQLEKRGTIVGDRSAGAVMEAEFFQHKTGGDTGRAFIVYGAEITVADIVMTDGKSLEHTGVTPDVVALPTASDLASGRDPVLAKAAELVGVTMTPEEAGKLFPYEWPKE
jgi:carboxyl-terminal processing protease